MLNLFRCAHRRATACRQNWNWTGFSREYNSWIDVLWCWDSPRCRKHNWPWLICDRLEKVDKGITGRQWEWCETIRPTTYQKLNAVRSAISDKSAKSHLFSYMVWESAGDSVSFLRGKRIFISYTKMGNRAPAKLISLNLLSFHFIMPFVFLLSTLSFVRWPLFSFSYHPLQLIFF